MTPFDVMDCPARDGKSTETPSRAPRGSQRERAIAALGLRPRDRRTRDEARWDGLYAIRTGTSLDERLDGAETVLRAWFEGSLDAAIEGDYWRSHPTFETYAAMMDFDRVFPTAITAELRRRYGRRAGIPTGQTFWLPAIGAHLQD